MNSKCVCTVVIKETRKPPPKGAFFWKKLKKGGAHPVGIVLEKNMALDPFLTSQQLSKTKFKFAI